MWIPRKIRELAHEMRERDVEIVCLGIHEDRERNPRFVWRMCIYDDVWKVDSEQWDLLCRPLSAVRGVNIALTTRNDGVPSITGRSLFTSPSIGVIGIRCLSVFAHHALGKA
uniref:NB-ARC domain-containing protein n=1 Tax=Salix viminalis TaxID=40686 RepID=A0A6N2LHM0_SALVM